LGKAIRLPGGIYGQSLQMDFNGCFDRHLVFDGMQQQEDDDN
jgi:hypothetical protein